VPFPGKEAGQVQVKEPMVSVHVATWSQLCEFVTHSSSFKHVLLGYVSSRFADVPPSPTYPATQLQYSEAFSLVELPGQEVQLEAATRE
jgi:hypothetical protein